MKPKQIISFSTLLLAICFTCRYFDRGIADLNTQSPWLLLWVFSPLLVTLIFRAVNRDRKGFGFRMHLKEQLLKRL